jgi:hypothetical protein
VGRLAAGGSPARSRSIWPPNCRQHLALWFVMLGHLHAFFHPRTPIGRRNPFSLIFDESIIFLEIMDTVDYRLPVERRPADAER